MTTRKCFVCGSELFRYGPCHVTRDATEATLFGICACCFIIKLPPNRQGHFEILQQRNLGYISFSQLSSVKNAERMLKTPYGQQTQHRLLRSLAKSYSTVKVQFELIQQQQQQQQQQHQQQAEKEKQQQQQQTLGMDNEKELFSFSNGNHHVMNDLCFTLSYPKNLQTAKSMLQNAKCIHFHFDTARNNKVNNNNNDINEVANDNTMTTFNNNVQHEILSLLTLPFIINEILVAPKVERVVIHFGTNIMSNNQYILIHEIIQMVLKQSLFALKSPFLKEIYFEQSKVHISFNNDDNNDNNTRIVVPSYHVGSILHAILQQQQLQQQYCISIPLESLGLRCYGPLSSENIKFLNNIVENNSSIHFVHCLSESNNNDKKRRLDLLLLCNRNLWTEKFVKASVNNNNARFQEQVEILCEIFEYFEHKNIMNEKQQYCHDDDDDAMLSSIVYYLLKKDPLFVQELKMPLFLAWQKHHSPLKRLVELD